LRVGSFASENQGMEPRETVLGSMCLASHRHVTLEPVNEQNREACLRLKVTPAQRRLIASNARSLEQASTNNNHLPMAIRCDGEVVGFLMYELRRNGVALLHRFMIDLRHQRQGIGQRAMDIFKARVADQGIETVFLSFRPDNLAARRLYARLGFVEQEIESDGEVLCRFGPAREIID